MSNNDDHHSGSDSDSDVDVAFASLDFSGVNFDVRQSSEETDDILSEDDKLLALAWERQIAFGEFSALDEGNKEDLRSLQCLVWQLALGEYAEALRGEVALRLFERLPDDDSSTDSTASSIRQRVFTTGKSILSCVELELLGVAAFNLFLQANYTGPTLSEDDREPQLVSDINPHPCFASSLSSSVDDTVNECEKLTASKHNTNYQNAVLSELAVEGEWPCQICNVPYFLLLARSIFLALADPLRADWAHAHASSKREVLKPPPAFLRFASHLRAAPLWCARSVVAHERLLQGREPPVTLWNEAEYMYQICITSFCGQIDTSVPNPYAATVMLEWGLAEHHFDRPSKGKTSFTMAQKFSGLSVEVTGAEGKRTKFQKKATAQMLVKASSAAKETSRVDSNNEKKDQIQGQMVKHSEDAVLLEKIKFQYDKENEVTELNVLDQAILLAFCLDVKNSNPADGLTAEEMGAYLARILDHHYDWMVYSTALLERSWLEFEQSHARERAILQMQALADQHTQRLTITQSTRESIEESAPVQERLKMLHCIIYPPRWSMIQDVADRYASLGVVSSAAELYTDIEMWDEVVECYRRAGKVSKAEQIVRERLETHETPRMWTALGELKNDPEHYKKAIELSRGRYSPAFVALGAYYFDKGDLNAAAENYEKAVKVRPLVPHVWFRLGTIDMQLGRWENALRAFSEVVQQEPEEAEAWANVAAIHMHNKKPAESYPALVESLKHSRNNWRVWVSKLYTCLDLQKYDEAVQACNMILDLKAQKQASEGVPDLEEKCVRAIVGGALRSFRESQEDEAAVESSRRTLSRVYELLNRISSSSEAAEPWVFETMTFFHDQMGQDEQVLDNLMKEYRSLQSIQGWEKDNYQVRKICEVVSHILRIYVSQDSRESLTKAKLLGRGVVKKILSSRLDDDSSIPEEVKSLEVSLKEIEEKLQKMA